MSKTKTFPRDVSQLLKRHQASGGTIHRRSHDLLFEGNPETAIFLDHRKDELVGLFIPSVSKEEAALVRDLLDKAEAPIYYIEDREVARQCTQQIVERQPSVLGVDFETEVLPEFQQPIPIKLNKDGTLAKRQPKDGAAGAAFDPYRSKVRLVQIWAGAGPCYIFDMRSIKWSDIEQLFKWPLAIFNAVFEVKRLIHEAGIFPSGRIFDVMTAHWLTDGQRPSLGDAVKINYNIVIPKTFGASDWSVNALSQEQLEYAALDAVFCYFLWQTQQENFDEFDHQAQAIADDVILATAKMELNGMPINQETHLAQIKEWELDFSLAYQALQEKAPLLVSGKATDLQTHLQSVLTADEQLAWPKTDSGKLVTTRQHLSLNRHFPGLTELLQLRAIQKLLNTFGHKLLDNINPVTGRIHASFWIAGASTGRFSSHSPNLQQMPNGRQKNFRQIFAAPPGKLILSADYSQIELRVVGELISEFIGSDSILRQSFAAGIDAHVATAMRLSGKERPEDVTNEERQRAKPCNFGLLYRMGNKGFFNYLRTNFMPDVSFEEACALRSRFFNGYPDLAHWQDRFSQQSKRDGFTYTAAGRRWRWKWDALPADDLDEDMPFYRDKLIGFDGAYAVNHPVQGSSAEIMMRALTLIDEALKGYEADLVATIHDEVVLIVPDDPQISAVISDIMRHEMTAAFLELFPSAPTVNLVSLELGPYWM